MCKWRIEYILSFKHQLSYLKISSIVFSIATSNKNSINSKNVQNISPSYWQLHGNLHKHTFIPNCFATNLRQFRLQHLFHRSRRCLIPNIITLVKLRFILEFDHESVVDPKWRPTRKRLWKYLWRWNRNSNSFNLLHNHCFLGY